MDASISLKIISGPMQGQEYFFDQQDTFIFGRSPDCHACLPNDKWVSRTHFLLEISPPHARIRDLGSLNGTFVNDIRLSNTETKTSPLQIALPDNAKIQVGQTTFVLSKLFPNVSYQTTDI